MVVLHQVIQREGIGVLAFLDNRLLKETENLLGPFQDSQIIGCDVIVNESFLQLMRRVANAVSSAPIVKSCEWASPLREIFGNTKDSDIGAQNRNSLIAFQYLRDGTTSQIGALCIKRVQFAQSGSDIGLRMQVLRGDTDVSLIVNFQSNTFDRSEVEKLLQRYQRVLECVISSLDIIIAEI
jgi:hypothetical protein